MRGVFLGCLFLAACGNQPGEKSLTTTSTKTDTQVVTQPGLSGDSSFSYAKDTSTQTAVIPVPVKKPSGVWEFLLPYDADTKILQTISFSSTGYRLQEEYNHGKDSTVVSEGTWAPSQGYIWLYEGHVVRGRYLWKGDTLQYFSPRLNKTFSMTRLTPATSNPVWQTKKAEGAVLFGLGTEPFWSVEVKKRDSIILSMPDWTEPLRAKLSTKARGKGGMIYTAASDSLEVTVLPYFCSDGMSDFTYSSKVTITYKGRTFDGCGIVF